MTGLQFEDDICRITRGGVKVMLSRTHYRYFRILHDAAGQMVSSQAICSAIYGDQKRSRQLVSVTICNLRKAIVPLGFEIIASNGIGYGLAEARK